MRLPSTVFHVCPRLYTALISRRSHAVVVGDGRAAALFARADKNGDGVLSHRELKTLLKESGVRDKIGLASGT